MTQGSISTRGAPSRWLVLEPGGSLGQAREWVRKAVGDLGADHCLAVQLVVTELLTNAHDHAGGAGTLRLRVEADPCSVYVELDDRSADAPILRQAKPEALRGRGLMMVDQLSAAWGSRPRAGMGKTVWAQISCETYEWEPCAEAA
ncbi:ATP-binding protein [Amycolatopsis sp. K13G38]|uniref:ATP-binding protein n=1 Tax=Amycolatopsis acididurans TaxID=2724524 RepID=A0ABX1J545_9PSEU|nr:ATP-binding protein [Amycolatopsis acididurans]NKQ54491.1 ATP-binding protein [Amycolatopsis acididurans]